MTPLAIASVLGLAVLAAVLFAGGIIIAKRGLDCGHGWQVLFGMTIAMLSTFGVEAAFHVWRSVP